MPKQSNGVEADEPAVGTKPAWCEWCHCFPSLTGHLEGCHELEKERLTINTSATDNFSAPARVAFAGLDEFRSVMSAAAECDPDLLQFKANDPLVQCAMSEAHRQEVGHSIFTPYICPADESDVTETFEGAAQLFVHLIGCVAYRQMIENGL